MNHKMKPLKTTGYTDVQVNSIFRGWTFSFSVAGHTMADAKMPIGVPTFFLVLISNLAKSMYDSVTHLLMI